MDAIEIQAKLDDHPAARYFLPADAAGAFRADFLDESVCRKWILTAIHGAGPITCMECSAPLTNVALHSFWAGRRICCRSCGKYFTATTKTFLAGCHMSFRAILLLAVLLHFDIPGRDIASILNISAETVRLWDVKFNSLKRIKKVEIDNG